MTSIKIIMKFREVFSELEKNKNVINISSVKSWFKFLWVLLKSFDFIKWQESIFHSKQIITYSKGLFKRCISKEWFNMGAAHEHFTALIYSLFSKSKRIFYSKFIKCNWMEFGRKYRSKWWTNVSNGFMSFTKSIKNSWFISDWFKFFLLFGRQVSSNNF